jgi:hypothetical protein
MGFEETEVVGKRDMRGANLLAMVLRHGQHGGHLRADERRREDHVHGQLADALARLDRLVHALLRERHVHAPREEVLRVPQRLPMADQNQRRLLCKHKRTPTSNHEPHKRIALMLSQI